MRTEKRELFLGQEVIRSHCSYTDFLGGMQSTTYYTGYINHCDTEIPLLVQLRASLCVTVLREDSDEVLKKAFA